jgi:hypothetical protein
MSAVPQQADLLHPQTSTVAGCPTLVRVRRAARRAIRPYHVGLRDRARLPTIWSFEHEQLV